MQLCFIVSIISAVAFTAIGTTAAIGNKRIGKNDKPIYVSLYRLKRQSGG